MNGNAGKIEHQVFEGTREEIRHDVMAQKDLPGNERDHLLRSLDMRQQKVQWPHLEYGPGWEFEFSWPYSLETRWPELFDDF